MGQETVRTCSREKKDGKINQEPKENEKGEKNGGIS